MPSLEEYKAHLIRADYGLAFLVLAVALVLVIGIRLWRWSALRELVMTAAPGIIPLALFPVNPPLGAISLAFGVGFEHLKRIRLTLGAIIVVALLLRLPLMFQSFWYDEAFTERITTLSLQELGPAIAADTHPPLYYSLMWLWSHLAGHSEFALRLPSLIYGLLGIVLLKRLVRDFGFSPTSGLIAAALMAVTPAAIYYATEARCYAMLTCAVFGALICILEDRPLGFIVCTALVGWLHNLGLLYVPALALAAVWFHRGYRERVIWERLRGTQLIRTWALMHKLWRIVAVIACVLASIWLPLALQQSKGISNGFWIGFDAGTPFTFFTLNSVYLPRDYILPVLLPTVFLTLAGFRASRLNLSYPRGKVLLAIVVLPPVLAIALSVVWAPVFLSRIFLPLTLIALVPLAGALAEQPGLRAVAAPLFLVGVIIFYPSADLIRPDYRSIVRDCDGADVLYSTAVDTALTLAPYWSGESRTWLGGKDRGLTFGVDQLPLFNMQSGDISDFSGKTVCSIYILTPRTLQTERDYVGELQAKYPYSLVSFPIHSELRIDVMKFTVP